MAFHRRTEEPLRIEGFDTPLSGRRALILGDSIQWLNLLAGLEAEQLYRGRTILVIHDTKHGVSVPITLWRRRWDAVFRVRENFEAQMVATYVANAPKPVRVVWICMGGASMSEIPRVIWSRWARQDITLLGCSEQTMIGGVEWECILFPQKCTHDTMEAILGARGGAACSGLVSKIREGLSEINTSGAAIVWSSIEESAAYGSLYWYDPKGMGGEIGWKKEDVKDILESIGRWVANSHET